MRWFSLGVVFMAMLAGAMGSSVAGGDPDTPVYGRDNVGEAQTIRQGVVGRIATAEGGPLADAMIVPVPLDEAPPPLPEIAIVSGEDGRYAWPLPAGDYEITVFAEGRRRATRKVRVRAKAVVEADFTLEVEQH